MDGVLVLTLIHALCRIEEMLVMHRDALDRIAVIYQYFSSFQKKYDAQIKHATQDSSG